MSHTRPHTSRGRALLIVFALVASSTWVGAQTHVKAPKNKYTPAQDVQLGREAAQQVEQQMPLLRDESVQSYVQRIGRRLVANIPSEFQHPEFQYSFLIVNAREINAFALPGGPMFVNRGMIVAAKDEGEVAGVMAHELSHVALRHGTAQATKATKYEIGQVAGAILGAVVGGTAGQVIAQGSQFGLGTAFLRFSREYEKDADMLGAQIMARAGYDPRSMADMFKTIGAQGGSRGPQWMSDHPDPGNRSAYIVKEAQSLHVSNRVSPSGDLQGVQAELRGMPQAPATEQITQNAQRNGGAGANGDEPVGTNGRVGSNVAKPSSRFRTYDGGGLFSVSVPDNWQETSAGNSVRFAPQGAVGSVGGQDVFTHGIEFAVARDETHDLSAATQGLVQSMTQGNPQLRAAGNAESVNFGGRQGLRIVLENRSEVTGESEAVVVNTTLMDDGNLFYSIGVAPGNEFQTYQQTLQRVNGSVRLTR